MIVNRKFHPICSRNKGDTSNTRCPIENQDIWCFKGLSGQKKRCSCCVRMFSITTIVHCNSQRTTVQLRAGWFRAGHAQQSVFSALFLVLVKQAGFVLSCQLGLRLGSGLLTVQLHVYPTIPFVCAHQFTCSHALQCSLGLMF